MDAIFGGYTTALGMQITFVVNAAMRPEKVRMWYGNDHVGDGDSQWSNL